MRGLSARWWMTALFCGALLIAPAGVAAVPGRSALSENFVEVVKKVRPAVVNVSMKKENKGPSRRMMEDPWFQFFFGQGEEGPGSVQQGLGSGVVVDARGYILTNNHVIEGADEVKVMLADEREFTAKIVGQDPRTDIAVIKVAAVDLPVAPLGDSSQLEVGELVLAIGSPFGAALSQTVTAGIVSALGRHLSDGMSGKYEDFIQTDAAINPGNSGGPLINDRGEVIGINSAIISNTQQYAGVGFAVPINMAREVMKQLIASGKVTRGWIGVVIQDLSDALAEQYNLPAKGGVLVGDVQEGGPAAAAGLQAGDVIISLDGIKFTTTNDLRNYVAKLPPGRKVKVRLQRDGAVQDRDLTIGELKAEEAAGRGAAEAAGQIGALEKLGLSVQPLDAQTAEQLGYAGLQGLLVADVEPLGLAAKSGLQRGDLIQEAGHRPLRRLADLQAAVVAARGGKVLLRVRRGEYSHYLVLVTK